RGPADADPMIFGIGHEDRHHAGASGRRVDEAEALEAEGIPRMVESAAPPVLVSSGATGARSRFLPGYPVWVTQFSLSLCYAPQATRWRIESTRRRRQPLLQSFSEESCHLLSALPSR